MSNQAKKKILLVEDEFFLAETIRDRLQFMGFEMALVENGAEALACLQNTPVDLIVMDIMMPVMDGWEAAQKIKLDPRLKKIPIIFLSARARDEDKERAKKIGVEDYLIKPFENSELVALIEKWT